MLREFIRHNFWLKVFALVLAVMSWLTARFAINNEIGVGSLLLNPITTVELKYLPIHVLQNVADPRVFQFNPTEVTVTITGEASRVRTLTEKDIRVFVDFTGVDPEIGSLQALEVHFPPGIGRVQVIPAKTRIVQAPWPEMQK